MSVEVWAVSCLAAMLIIAGAWRVLGTDRFGLSRAQMRAYEQMALATTDDGILVQDLKGRILWANRAYCMTFGVELDEILGRNPLEFVMTPEDRPSKEEIEAFRYDVNDPAWDRLTVYRNQRSNGELFWNQLRVTFHKDPLTRQTFAVLVCRDASHEVGRENRLKEETEKLDHVAHHDMLTGAANRSRLIKFADEAIKTAQEDGHHVGLMQIDLDQFKLINDTYGHRAGDAVLKHVATQVRSCLRKTDLLARTGGDEFVVVCPRMDNALIMQQIGSSILDAVRQPVMFEGAELLPSISIGVAFSILGRSDLEELLRQADLALYEVKNAGRGAVALYNPDKALTQLRRMRQTDALKKAVADRKITFRYEPMTDAQTGQLHGFFITPSWRPEAEDPIEAMELRSIANACGQLSLLDVQAAEAALAWQSKLERMGWDQLRTYSFISTSLLQNATQLAQFRDRMAKAQSRSARHVCCITDLLQVDIEEISSPLNELRAAGPKLWGDTATMGFRQLAQSHDLHLEGMRIRMDVSGDEILRHRKMIIQNHMIQSAIDLSLDIGLAELQSQTAVDFARTTQAAVLQGPSVAPNMTEQQTHDWLNGAVDAQTGIVTLNGQLPLPASEAI